VNLSVFAEDSTVAVLDAVGAVAGRVKPVYTGRRVTMRIPKALIGNDDGFVNAAAIVGNSTLPTDFVPKAGHLTLAGANQVASLGAGALLRRVPIGARWEAATPRQSPIRR
jgi:hypothetical protein